MLSRLANSLYWMSRYLERVGNTARLLNINLLNILEDEDPRGESAIWRPILEITSSEASFRTLLGRNAITARDVIQYMTWEPSNSSAIRSSLRLARENARVVRDGISKEMWETINEFWLRIDSYLQEPLTTNKSLDFFSIVAREVARFHGMTVGTMMRGEPFAFYLLGTFLERSDMSARILDVKYHILLPDVSMVGSSLDYYQWRLLLDTLSAFEAYRHKYHAGLRPLDVAEFVVAEEGFPRSLRFCADRMCDALATIGCPPGDCSVREAMGALNDHLNIFSVEGVLQVGLHEYLVEYLHRVASLNAAVATDYFESFLGEEVCAT